MKLSSSSADACVAQLPCPHGEQGSRTLNPMELTGACAIVRTRQTAKKCSQMGCSFIHLSSCLFPFLNCTLLMRRVSLWHKANNMSPFGFVLSAGRQGFPRASPRQVENISQPEQSETILLVHLQPVRKQHQAVTNHLQDARSGVSIST